MRKDKIVHFSLLIFYLGIVLILGIGGGFWWHKYDVEQRLVENQVWGVVTKWDSVKGVVTLIPRGGGQMEVIITSQVTLVSFDADENNQLNQILVFRDMNDWETAFCEGDKVRLDLKRDEKREWMVYKVTDLGPRICR